MTDFAKSLAVDERATLQFFFSALYDEAGDKVVSKVELLYTASVLAHYAQTSTGSTSSLMPSPRTLSDVFDQFVLTQEGLSDPELLETAGAWTLFLNGLFRRQMGRRHNVDWFDQLGESFYGRASHALRDRKKAELCYSIARSFRDLTRLCYIVGQKFHQDQYLLRLN